MSSLSVADETILDPGLVWTYGLLLVTGINLCSLFGIALNPFSKRSWFKYVLLFMVANAVGVLSGSSFLFLLSGALGIADKEWHARKEYIWRISVLLATVFFFFNFEQFLKLFLQYFVARKKQKQSDSPSEGQSNPALNVSTPQQLDLLPEALRTSVRYRSKSHGSHVTTLSIAGEGLHQQPEAEDIDEKCQQQEADVATTPQQANGETVIAVVQVANEAPTKKRTNCSNFFSSMLKAQPVAWMIVFGDGLHNFVDGLSIGAGMARSLPDGLSIALAVLAEELPHELGDFAVLLTAGLSVRQALFLNFMSACMCYMGFVVGVLLGEASETSNIIIFSLAAGLFLYISLTDLLPELSPDSNEHGKDSNHGHSHSKSDTEEKQKSVCSTLRHILIADLGMLIGYGLMVILAIYADEIAFPSTESTLNMTTMTPSTDEPIASWHSS